MAQPNPSPINTSDVTCSQAGIIAIKTRYSGSFLITLSKARGGPPAHRAKSFEQFVSVKIHPSMQRFVQRNVGSASL
jgi:hypothetical protein